MGWFAAHKKLVSSVVSAGIAWATIVVQSAPGPISGSEWLAGAVLLAGALGVNQLTNAPGPIPPTTLALPPPK